MKSVITAGGTVQFNKESISKLCPTYALIPLASCFIWNCLLYNGVRIINAGRTHYDLTTSFDVATPLIPSFILIYFGCFVSWGIYYVLCARTSKESCARFVTFDLITRTICGIIFIALPTYNIRPQIVNDGIFWQLLQFLYHIDNADNLFPSIHCLVSWNCFVGIRGLKCYKKRYKVLAFVIAILVFIATLVTKQHVILDVISAVVISEACWYLVKHTNIDKVFWRFFNKVNDSVFGNSGMRD